MVLHRIDLSGADLREVNLSKTHLSYVKFYESNWENSQLGKVISCDFRNANLSHCNFTNLQIIYSDLRGVNLAGLDMTATNFIGSNLQGSQGSFNFLDSGCLATRLGLRENLFLVESMLTLISLGQLEKVNLNKFRWVRASFVSKP